MALSGGRPASRVRGCRVKSARTRTRGLGHLAPVWCVVGPMEPRSLYDDDIYAWAQEQAAALRRLAETCRDLPNELDLENVAEEIEDVRRSELVRVESFIRLILVHLIKAASAPQARSFRKWGGGVRVFRAELLRHLTPSLRGRIDVDELWRLAQIRAEVDLM